MNELYILTNFSTYLNDQSITNSKLDFNFNLLNSNQRYIYNNHYPIFISNSLVEKKITKKFKKDLYIDYFKFIQLNCIGFLEFFFKKRFYIRVSSNYFNNSSYTYINFIYKNYKNNKFKNLKNFKIIDFIEII